MGITATIPNAETYVQVASKIQSQIKGYIFRPFSSKSRRYTQNQYKMLIVGSLLLLSLSKVLGAAAATGDSYTEEELQILPQFMARVDDYLTQDYMAENGYLIRFLRAQSLDMDAAEKMLREAITWRLENYIDDLELNDFPHLFKKNPAYLTTDKNGRPAMVGAGISHLNLRKYAVSGKGDDLMRYNYFLLDKTVEALDRVSNETGINYQGATFIFNLAGYSAKTHACSACLPYYAQLVEYYEKYYPQLGHELILVNAPKIFEVVLRQLRPLMSEHTQSVMQIFGRDKREWRDILSTVFDSSSLTPAYGGSLKLTQPEL